MIQPPIKPPCLCYACGTSLAPRLFLGLRQTILELILANPGVNSEKITDYLFTNKLITGDSGNVRQAIKRMRPALAANGYVLTFRSGSGGGYTLRTNEAP